jgi:hypothetical protein
MPSIWSLTMCPPSSSPTFSDRSRLMRPPPPLPQRRHRERLGADVERDRRAVSARFDTNDGETHAGIGDRRPDGNRPAS